MKKDLNEIHDGIVGWLGEKKKETAREGFVVGMSGGLDSSVTAILAKEAAGDKLLGLVMPCHSDEENVRHAEVVAEKFKIKTLLIDLTPVFDIVKKSLPPEESRIADANLKSRLRMTVLYYFANTHNYLVLGTGNKSEIKTGYFTKYGDAGCDLLPLGNLYKTEIIELAEMIGVPEVIIKKPPSPGLWPEQTDEKEIGMGYDDLDRILKCLERNETGEIDQEKLKRVKNMIKKSEHKRRTPEVFGG